jgi:hypothetical protein
MACKIYDNVRLTSNTLYVCEIIEADSEGCFLTDGKPDIKINIGYSLF